MCLVGVCVCCGVCECVVCVSGVCVVRVCACFVCVSVGVVCVYAMECMRGLCVVWFLCGVFVWYCVFVFCVIKCNNNFLHLQ